MGVSNRATWIDRSEAVKVAARGLLHHEYNVAEYCEAVAERYIRNFEHMTNRQLDEFVTDVTAEVNARKSFRSLSDALGGDCK